jgi:hypothetical protein
LFYCLTVFTFIYHPFQTKKPMKRISNILLTTSCLLAMGFGCGRDCPEVELPIDQDITVTLKRNCRILNRDMPPPGQTRHVALGGGSATDATEYVINSREELLRYVVCVPDALDAVDFERYTVIAGQKLIGTMNFGEQSLALRCDVVHYRLVFDRVNPHTNNIRLIDYFAVVPKLQGRPTIVYQIE